MKAETREILVGIVIVFCAIVVSPLVKSQSVFAPMVMGTLGVYFVMMQRTRKMQKEIDELKQKIRSTEAGTRFPL